LDKGGRESGLFGFVDQNLFRFHKVVRFFPSAPFPVAPPVTVHPLGETIISNHVGATLGDIAERSRIGGWPYEPRKKDCSYDQNSSPVVF